jgi:invasion protein IalB
MELKLACKKFNFTNLTLSIFFIAGLKSPLLAQEPDTFLERYGNWAVECTEKTVPDATEQELVCRAFQELRQEQTGQRVLLVSFANGPEKEDLILSMITPFGLNVTSEIFLNADNAEVAKIGFTTCVPTGCIAEGVVSRDAADSLGHSVTMQVSMPINKESGGFVVDLSTVGFWDALDRLEILASRLD